MKKNKMMVSKKYINSVDDFYSSLTDIFKTEQFKHFYNDYIFNNMDADISTIYFILFYFIYTKNKNIEKSIESLKTIMMDGNNRTSIINFFVNLPFNKNKNNFIGDK